MKYLIIFSLIFMGCKNKEKAINVEYIEKDTYVSCNSYVYHHCGLTLYNCTNKKIYRCMRNVEFIENE